MRNAKVLNSRTLFLALAILSGAWAAWAQPCQSDVPDSLILGQSHCIKVCPFQQYSFFLWCPYLGCENFPHIVMTPGCASGGPDCHDPACQPVVPPAWPWQIGEPPQFGQDPSHPNDIYIHNDCFEIYIYCSHPGYWTMDVWSTCAGCFCLWFDWQLPVEMKSFDAVAGDGEVSLSWETASESNNDHFLLRRDDLDIAQVPSQGNGPSGHTYAWTDRSLDNGRTYTYRLIAVDINGNYDEAGVQSATPTQTAPGSVTDYALSQNHPNPFNPMTSITFDLPEAGYVNLKVFNAVGEAVATLVNGTVAAGRHSVSFDGSHLPSGIYFYSINVGNAYSATRKMLLVK